jgi:hypothetical protein
MSTGTASSYRNDGGNWQVRRIMRLELEYYRSAGGRPQGTLCGEDAVVRPFEGTLDLLRLLDELSQANSGVHLSPRGASGYTR